MAQWVMFQQVTESENAQFFLEYITTQRAYPFQVFDGAVQYRWFCVNAVSV